MVTSANKLGSDQAILYRVTELGVRLDLLTFDYKEARKAGISLTTETRRTQCLIRRPGRQELKYG